MGCSQPGHSAYLFVKILVLVDIHPAQSHGAIPHAFVNNSVPAQHINGLLSMRFKGECTLHKSPLAPSIAIIKRNTADVVLDYVANKSSLAHLMPLSCLHPSSPSEPMQQAVSVKRACHHSGLIQWGIIYSAP